MAMAPIQWPKGGDEIGSSGHIQKGEKVIVIIDNHGSVFAPVPVAPVNATDVVLLPQGRQALQQRAKQVGLAVRGAYVNLDGGCDAAHQRTCIGNVGLIPNIPKHPRNGKTTKRGRKRLFNVTISALRRRAERIFAWEDTCKRLLLRCERL